MRTARTEIQAEFASEHKLELPTGVPSPAEIRTILDTVQTLPPDASSQTRRVRQRDYLMIRLLYLTGIRRQELLDLVVGDINFSERVLFVRSGKGDKDRYLLVDAITLELLKQWVGTGSAVTPLFLISHFWSDNNFRKYCLDCGLYQAYQERGLRLSVHSMRHAFATHRYQLGMDFFAIMTLMGHSFIDTTAIYLRTATQQINQVYAQTNPFAEPSQEWPRLRPSQDGTPTGDDELKPDWPEALERAQEFANQLPAARNGGLPCFPSHTEIVQLLQDSAVNPEHALLFRLLYASGMHLNEMLSLNWDQVLWDTSRLLRPNGASVCIDPHSLQMLQQWQPNHAQIFQLSAEQANGALLDTPTKAAWLNDSMPLSDRSISTPCATPMPTAAAPKEWTASPYSTCSDSNISAAANPISAAPFSAISPATTPATAPKSTHKCQFMFTHF